MKVPALRMKVALRVSEPVSSTAALALLSVSDFATSAVSIVTEEAGPVALMVAVSVASGGPAGLLGLQLLARFQSPAPPIQV